MKGRKASLLTDESLAVDVEMIDQDNVNGFGEQFSAGASIEEGVSGRKGIDTMFENTSQDQVDQPREGSTPAPVNEQSFMFPHRSL